MALFSGSTPIPQPSGPHAIGTTRLELTQPGYDDPWAASPTPRRVPLQLWYPAQPGGTPETTLDDVLRAAISAFTHVPKFALGKRASNSVVDAPAVPGRWPVLIFNHGFASFQKQSTSLLEELASHGYVVLSVGHPSESLVVQFTDGTVVHARTDAPAWRAVSTGLKDLLASAREVEPLMVDARAARTADALHAAMTALAKHPSYAQFEGVLVSWRRDMGVVLDQLERLDDGSLSPLLKGVVDARHVGVFGHSLGGILAGQLAMTDARVGAGLNFDGAQLPQPGVPYRLAAPFCFLYADTTKVSGFALTNEGMNDALLVDAPPRSCSASLRGATHLNFTDMNNRAMLAAALGSIDRGEMARLLRAMTVGFFDHHLKGRPLAGFTPSATLRVHWSPERPHEKTSGHAALLG